jgi:hypothetical protein
MATVSKRLDTVGISAIKRRDSLIARLDRVREISHAFGYGVGDDMDYLLAKRLGIR